MARRRARELAFRTLFQSERGSEPLLEVWNSVRIDLADSEEEPEDDTYGDPLDRPAIQFADELLRAYDADREHVDELLRENISGWSFPQMSQTDLNVLRLAVTEMYHVDTAPEVAIEMAIRVAKKFGGDESGRFVNGVLAKVLRQVRKVRESRESGAGGGEAGVP
ncbi:MAG TPA: transcription antitermination factor NusB, partial [Trueperaceae bacterium]|nr:transcription antitermination factor NusB [Trueperaceae bacterium]